MEIRFQKNKKRVEIWLTHDEGNDEALLASLQPIYEICKNRKWLVVVYHSGTGDMIETMVALLRHNREIQAKAQREGNQYGK